MIKKRKNNKKNKPIKKLNKLNPNTNMYQGQYKENNSKSFVHQIQ
jgi:hypothetical protein